MRFKDVSVVVHGVQPELILALYVADEVYREAGVEEGIVITSMNDATHSETSLHYAGAAADIRIRSLPDSMSPAQTAKAIKARLTVDFDVVVEADHIHIEYQPRRRK